MTNEDIFLGKLYDILISSEVISYDDKPKDLKEKKERLEKYLSKLDRVQNKAMTREENIQRLKKLYYEKYIIKPENISDAYFESLERRYLEEGHGHHNLVNPNNYVDKELRQQHINMIIKEQKDSLDTWLNYFLSKDSDYLPIWAKVWAFQGMLSIGNLNKDKDGYGRRSKTSVNPFVSFDSEILGKCVELIKETFNEKDITDKEVEKLVSSGSFSKLYGKLLAKKKGLKMTSDDGIWIKYNYETKQEADRKLKEGKEPEYLKLYNSLQGYNTGWCTAGSKETAKSQICGGSPYQGGDFYVYYTKDNNNEYKIPRIAIRMDGISIGEIRGVAESQNIESNMELVLEEKLKEFPDAKLYQKKVSDMKKLTEIYNNYSTRDLTKEELRFLYEIDEEIVGFGYKIDPRIKEILDKRDIKEDFSRVFNCSKEEIGTIYYDSFTKDLVCYIGDIYSKKTQLPKTYLKGNLDLSGLTSAKGLNLPQTINGDLNLSGLTSAEGLNLPQSIKGNLDLSGLTSAEGLNLPQNTNGDLDLSGITSAEGLNLPQSVNGSLDLNGLTSAEGLNLPLTITGCLYIGNLNSIVGLKFNVKRIYYGGHSYNLEEIISLQEREELKLIKNEQNPKRKVKSAGFINIIYMIVSLLVISFISMLLGVLIIK